MGNIHIRNLRVATTGAGSTFIERGHFWMLREMFDIGRWDEDALDSDSQWTSASNVLLDKGVNSGTADLAVAAADAMQISSATGGFDAAHEGHMISLFASNDANRSIYNISRVLDSNNLLVDERTRAGNWADETGIAGRIHKASDGDPFPGSANYIVMGAPTASGRSIQIHFTHDGGVNFYFVAYPEGDYGGTAYATDQLTQFFASGVNAIRYNAFFSDALSTEFYALLYFYDSVLGDWRRVMVGELSDVGSGDDYPGFIHSGLGTDMLAGTFGEHIIYMLNETHTAIESYPTFYKDSVGRDADNMRERQGTAKKISGGKAKVFRPLVITENSANGGFMRGNIPNSFCHKDFPDDEFGSGYWKLGDHMLVPRNGSNDPKPLESTA
jgi:hypothetical protein